MRSIAIVKPDHLGDLVLASPAINWLASRSRETTLFVQRSVLPLARYLFPAIGIEEISLPHLNKTAFSEKRTLASSLAAAAGRDLCVFLRTDHVLCRERVSHLVGRCIFTDIQGARHEATNHRMGVRVYFGDYASDATWPGTTRPFPPAVRTVGLCIGSGFPTNKWSAIRWTELGRLLASRDIGLRLIGGPQESRELELLATTLAIANEHVIVGGADIAAFLGRVNEADVVIASDGGAGHLCSLAAPVLSLAASVPFRRFAPFGAETRTVSLDLPCSPCINAHETMVNMCFSHECSYGIAAADVVRALFAAPAPPGTVVPVGVHARLFYGVSHVH